MMRSPTATANTRELYYLTDRLEWIKTEQGKYTELGQDKARLYNELCSVEALQGLRNIEVPAIEALREPGRNVENNAVLSNVIDLSKTDWRGSLDKAKQLGAMKNAVDLPKAAKVKHFEIG